jgi:ABC-type dipeptide/oligopeptide/nickel transport system permease component
MPLHQRFRIAGLAIFVLGLLAAVVIYLLAPEVDLDEIAYQEMATKQYERQIEMNGGKNLVLAAQFTHWFGGLWHGRRLAASLAVLSVLAALLCRALAGHALAVQEAEEGSGEAGGESRGEKRAAARPGGGPAREG